jgi:hypothetical protein
VIAVGAVLVIVAPLVVAILGQGRVRSCCVVDEAADARLRGVLDDVDGSPQQRM